MPEIKMPAINVNDDTVTLTTWLVSNGDYLTKGQAICEVETSKTTEEVTCPETGIIQGLIEPGEIEVGKLIARIGEDEYVEETSLINDSLPLNNRLQDAGELPRFSKAALLLMKDRQIDQAVFVGRSLIKSKDVLEHLGEGESSGTSLNTIRPAHLPPSKRKALRNNDPAISKSEMSLVTNKPLKSSISYPSAVKVPRRKKEEIKVLSEGHHPSLPSVLTQFVQISGVKDYLRKLDNPVTLLAITAYEVAALLKEYKVFNAMFTDQGIVYHENIHIGIAMDGEHGLKVPAIKTADTLTVNHIMKNIELHYEAYLTNTLTIDSLTSATFNISDLTNLEIPWFIPLISKNQSAILGMGYAGDNGIETLSLTLTFDHRVTEGKTAGEFLLKLKERLNKYTDLAKQNKNTTLKEAVPCCSKCYKSMNELIEGNRVLLKMVNARGEDELICRLCLEGWL